MALFHLRSVQETLLPLANDGGEALWNHILEPEYHQAVYVEACTKAQQEPGSVQLGDPGLVDVFPFRGIQPQYADDDADPDSLRYEGLTLADGTTVAAGADTPVCALKSVCVRKAYVDYETARSAPRVLIVARN